MTIIAIACGKINTWSFEKTQKNQLINVVDLLDEYKINAKCR
jgi:hypothetical protein